VNVDYKTDNVRDDALAARMRHHSSQLAFYALALSEITSLPVHEAHVLFLAPGLARTLEITPALLAEARTWKTDVQGTLF
jgi:hypothetical protein